MRLSEGRPRDGDSVFMLLIAFGPAREEFVGRRPLTRAPGHKRDKLVRAGVCGFGRSRMMRAPETACTRDAVVWRSAITGERTADGTCTGTRFTSAYGP